MSEEHRCPTCGQEVPGRYKPPAGAPVVTQMWEPLQTSRRRKTRNASDDSLQKARRRDSRDNLKLWLRHRSGHETGCVMCGGDLPANIRSWYSDHRRVSSYRMFCSNACRQRAHRILKKVRQEAEI